MTSSGRDPAFCAPDAAQRVSDALLIRGRSKLCAWNGPGSAKQRCTPHRARDKDTGSPHARGRHRGWIILAATIAFAASLNAAASELNLTPPQAPAQDRPLRPDLPECDHWTDDCVTCWRESKNEAPVCSNIGIACQPQAVRCIGGESAPNGPQGK